MRSAVLNDIGPVLEPDGLQRIKGYIGRDTRPRDLAEAITILQATTAGHFSGLSGDEWRAFAITTFGADETCLHLRCDPAIAKSFNDVDLSRPLPDLWPQFDALRDLPVLTLRGSNSDLLSPATFAAMRGKWSGCAGLEIEGQGHAPLMVDARSINSIANFMVAAD